MSHLSVQHRQQLLSSFASWRLTIAFPSSPAQYQVELILRAAMERCHDRFFIMTDVIFHILFKVMDICPECAKGPCHQDVFLKECFWHLTSWRGVSVFFLPTVMQRDRLWLVSLQVVKLQDWPGNVCWHGDQLSLLKQLVLMKHKITTVC